MSPIVTADMTFNQIFQLVPQAAEILTQFNLDCVGCLAASTETLAQGARLHGLSVEPLLAALNAAVDP